MSYAQADAANVRAQVAELIAAYPELEDDTALRTDVMEGETDFHRVIERLVKSKLDAKAMAAAIKDRVSDISERKRRFERQEEGYAALIKSLMLAADLPKLVLPDATVSVTAPKTTVEITDADALPQGFVRIERVPMKTEIKKALEAGDEIPGAKLGLSEDGLQVRPK